MDVAQVGITLVIGVVVPAGSGYMGIRIGQALLKQELLAFKEQFAEYKAEHAGTSKEWKTEINSAIATHKAETTETFKRVIFQDSCTICGANGKERHAELLRQIGEVKNDGKTDRAETQRVVDAIRAEVAETKRLLIDCFDNLGRQMRGEK